MTTHEDEYPKHHTLRINDEFLTEIVQYAEPNLWQTDFPMTHYTDDDVPFMIGEGKWGETIEESVDAIYDVIEAQAPGYLASRLFWPKPITQQRARVLYTSTDPVDGEPLPALICYLLRNEETGHWVTDRTVDMPRSLYVPRRLWGRDKTMAIARVQGYMEGVLVGQSRHLNQSTSGKHHD